MEAFVNERKVKVNTEIGRWSSLGGLVVLIVGLVVSFRRPELVWVTMLCLLVGFLASIFGAYYANHWTRTPRADQLLTQALKGISNRYHMYHYLLPVPHVLLGPTGLYVIRAFLHEGRVWYDGKRWRQKRSVTRFLGMTGQDALADPVRDAEYDAERLRRWLAKRMEEKAPESRRWWCSCARESNWRRPRCACRSSRTSSSRRGCGVPTRSAAGHWTTTHCSGSSARCSGQGSTSCRPAYFSCTVVNLFLLFLLLDRALAD